MVGTGKSRYCAVVSSDTWCGPNGKIKYQKFRLQLTKIQGQVVLHSIWIHVNFIQYVESCKFLTVMNYYELYETRFKGYSVTGLNTCPLVFSYLQLPQYKRK